MATKAYNSFLRDQSGNIIYPKTRAENIIYDNGSNVYETITGFQTAIDNNKSRIQNIVAGVELTGITTIEKTLTLTTEWQNTGIAGANLPSGTYVVEVSGMASSATSLYTEKFSGVMVWYDGGTNSEDSDEIFLHNAGHASNGRRIFLRTKRNPNPGTLQLQIAASVAFSSTKYTFKFKRLI